MKGVPISPTHLTPFGGMLFPNLQVCRYNYYPKVIQSKILRCLFGVHAQCIPNAMLSLEAGLVMLESQVWLQVICFWFKLNLSPSNLTYLILVDSFHSSWMGKIEDNFKWLCMTVLYLGYYGARTIVKHWDFSLQLDRTQTHLIPAVENCNKILFHLHISIYFPKHCKAFTLDQLNVLSIALLKGRFVCITYRNHLCPYHSVMVESSEHVLLNCWFYQNIQNVYITFSIFFSFLDIAVTKLKILCPGMSDRRL